MSKVPIPLKPKLVTVSMYMKDFKQHRKQITLPVDPSHKKRIGVASRTSLSFAPFIAVKKERLHCFVGCPSVKKEKRKGNFSNIFMVA